MSKLIQLHFTLQQLRSGIITDADVRFLFTATDFPFIKFMIKEGMIMKESAAIYAAIHGNVEVLKWAFEKGYPFDLNEYFSKAMAMNNEIEDLICQHIDVTNEHLELALKRDLPNLVFKILDLCQEEWTNDLTIKALQVGAWDVLKMAHEKELFKDVALPTTSAEGEVPAAIQEWIRVMGKPDSRNAYLVADRGRLDVLKWFFPEGKGCGVKVWLRAKNHHYVDILHWLHQSRPENPDFKKADVIQMAHRLGRKDLLDFYKN